MATPSNGPKTGKDGRETGKEKGHALRRGLGWLVLDRASRWLVVGVAIRLKRDFAFDVIGKGVRFHRSASRQIFVTLR